MTDTTENTAPVEEPRIRLASDSDPVPPTPEADDVTPEAESVMPEAEQDNEPEPEPQPEKKRDAQSRIRELNARAKAAEERAAALEAQLNGRSEQQQQPAQDFGLVKPNPADYVGGRFNDDYQDAYEAYQEARAEARVQAALEQREAVKTVENTVKTIQQREDAFRAQHTDYDDALAAVMDYGVIDDPTVYRAIVEMENSPEIVYRIGSDENLLAELSELSPSMRLIRIGGLLANQAAPQPAAARRSKAPAPIEPVKGGHSPVLTGQAALDAAKNYDEYKAAKRAMGL